MKSIETAESAASRSMGNTKQYLISNGTRNRAKSNGIRIASIAAFLVLMLATKQTFAQDVALGGGGDDVEQTEESEPTCLDSRSICGYMQINRVGINRVPICACKGNLACPLLWNPFDGHTIRHGNDFYKYCNRRPKLNSCGHGQLAYSSYGESDLITGRKLADIQRMHCLCPSDHILATNKTMYEVLETTYIYGTESLCQKPPVCSRKQYCASITETADTTLEKRHCRCSTGRYCPRDFRMAAESLEMDKGTLYHMKCV